jgi:hypothetical protein
MPEEWSGVERRAGPDPAALQAELRLVRQDVGRLATSVTTLGSDEKLQAAVNSVAEEQKRHWQKLLATVTAALLVIVIVVAVGATWANDAKDAAAKAKVAADNAARAANDSAKVAAYVDHCLVHPTEATPGECGNTQATGQQSATVLALFCFLKLPQEQRSETTAKTCFMSAAAQAKASSAAATTTTTSKGHD